MLNLSKTLDTAISIESATARLTETILGNDDRDLAETLRTIASDIGLSHISYVRLSPDKSPDMCYSASHINFKLPAFPVHLSNREEQCLLRAIKCTA